MLAIISPAKTLDFESVVRNLPVSQPHLTDYSEQLIEICRQLSPQDLSSLMSISDKLAGLNTLVLLNGQNLTTKKIHAQPFGHSKVMFTPVWMLIVYLMKMCNSHNAIYVCFLAYMAYLNPLI